MGGRLDRFLTDPAVLHRFRSKVTWIPGSDCLWWTGAISRNAGHGRFWLGQGQAIVAHRFAYAIAEGAEALDDVELLAHGCDNPLCQRVDAGHLSPATRSANRIAWQARGSVAAGNYIGPEDSFERALIMRNLLRIGADVAAQHLASLPHRYGYQPRLV